MEIHCRQIFWLGFFLCLISLFFFVNFSLLFFSARLMKTWARIPSFHELSSPVFSIDKKHRFIRFLAEAVPGSSPCFIRQTASSRDQVKWLTA
jgi:hypothetical protein